MRHRHRLSLRLRLYLCLCLAALALSLCACFRTADPEGDGACPPESADFPRIGGGHVLVCSEIDWPTRPPQSGFHFEIHAEFKTYADSVPYGFLVHSLEHGAVVIGYNCPQGCAQEVALAQAFIDAWPEDAHNPICDSIRCHPQPKKRFILAPDPRLSTRWSATTWGSIWKSCTLDTASLGAFARPRYRKAPEDLMGEDGVDFSAKGWCPNPFLTP